VDPTDKTEVCTLAKGYKAPDCSKITAATNAKSTKIMTGVEAGNCAKVSWNDAAGAVKKTGGCEVVLDTAKGVQGIKKGANMCKITPTATKAATASKDKTELCASYKAKDSCTGVKAQGCQWGGGSVSADKCKLPKLIQDATDWEAKCTAKPGCGPVDCDFTGRADEPLSPDASIRRQFWYDVKGCAPNTYTGNVLPTKAGEGPGTLVGQNKKDNIFPGSIFTGGAFQGPALPEVALTKLNKVIKTNDSEHGCLSAEDVKAGTKFSSIIMGWDHDGFKPGVSVGANLACLAPKRADSVPICNKAKQDTCVQGCLYGLEPEEKCCLGLVIDKSDGAAQAANNKNCAKAHSPTDKKFTMESGDVPKGCDSIGANINAFTGLFGHHVKTTTNTVAKEGSRNLAQVITEPHAV